MHLSPADAYPSGTDSVETQLNLLKVHALGAHRVSLDSDVYQGVADLLSSTL